MAPTYPLGRVAQFEGGRSVARMGFGRDGWAGLGRPNGARSVVGSPRPSAGCSTREAAR